MDKNEMQELINLLGTNYSVTIFFQHKDELKTLEAYKMALDGVIRGNHSFELIRALTYNMITDYKRSKVNVESWGCVDRNANELRSSGFSLVDVLDSWGEVLLSKDDVDKIEKVDNALYHAIDTILMCETVRNTLEDSIGFPTETLERYMDEIGAMAPEAVNEIGEGILDIIHILLPNGVSDTGDYGDCGQYMCGTFIDSVEAIIKMEQVPVSIREWISETYEDTVNAVKYFASNCAPIIERVWKLAYDFNYIPVNDNLSEANEATYELVADLYDDIKETVVGYARAFYGTSDSDMIVQSESEHVDRLSEAGGLLATSIYDFIIRPIETAIRVLYPNAFDESALRSTFDSVISANIQLHDRMIHAVDGNMCVSYDGSDIDDELQVATQAVAEEDDSTHVPIADLLHAKDISDGWVQYTFRLYDYINDALQSQYLNKNI